MFEYLFTFQSLTAAQSARSVLNTEGIRAPVGRSARKLSANGCGYVLRVSARDGIRALHVLRKNGAEYVHLYRVYPSGMLEEGRV